MVSSQRIMLILGYAGLIPFVIPALVVVIDSEYSTLALRIAEAYAFGIISFLTGSWWGMALTRDAGKALLLSNLYFLVGLLIFVFALQWWALAAAILLMSIYFAEQTSPVFTDLESRYRRMRGILTMVASASMLTLHLAA